MSEPTDQEVKAARTKHVKKQADLIDAYKATFSTPSGKKVLNDLMATHFVYSTTFTEAKSELIILREGERNVVMRILSLLETNPASLRKLIQEGLSDGNA